MVILSQSAVRHNYSSRSVFILTTPPVYSKSVPSKCVESDSNFKSVTFNSFSSEETSPKVLGDNWYLSGPWITILFGIIDMPVVRSTL